VTTVETMIRIESIRIPQYRLTYGSCLDLAKSIGDEGLRHPVTVWKDGTLISGGRRIRAHLLEQKDRIPAVFVSTIEDAAKRLLEDQQDPHLALPMKWSEICRLWARLRELDAPAAAKRADEGRRQGARLRKLTQAGKRAPGKSSNRSQDYTLNVIREPFGLSYATSRRVETVYEIAYGNTDDPRRALAVQVMKELDEGAAVWPCYQRMLDARPDGPRPNPNGRIGAAAPPVAPPVPATAARWLAAHERALPLLEGALAGLIELGAPPADLDWSQVGPVVTRLAAFRRGAEQLIKKMKENNQA
jgi:hypothetical protein